MSYLQIDDNMAEHPKLERISDTAFRLHITALCYCARHLTDGFISERAVRRFYFEAMADESRSHSHVRGNAIRNLMAAGLWDRSEGGWQIHDYHDWNLSRAEVLERRESKRQAGLRGAQSRWGSRNGNSSRHGTSHSNSHGTSHDVRNAPLLSSPVLPPNPRIAGEQEEGDLEPLTPREAGTNPRAVKQRNKAARSHAAFVERTVGLYYQWLAEPDRTPEGVADEIRQAYPDIADDVLTKVGAKKERHA